MATTTITAMRTALLALLQARAGLAGVQLGYGMPPGALQREHMLLWLVEASQEYRALGTTRKFEDYTVTMHIGVVREGTNQKAADERALALMADVEAALRTDPTVSGTVLTAEVARYRLEPLASETTREARITLDIQTRARI
jgi:hypothetical protein